MTPYQYAKRYGKYRRDVDRYLKEGRICGAKCVDGKWDIPEDALIKVKIRSKKNRTMADLEWDILSAANRLRFFDAETLHVQKPQFFKAVALLQEAALIQADFRPFDGITSTGYSITQKGVEYVGKRKDNFIDNVIRRLGMFTGELSAPLITSVSSAAS